MIERRRLPDGYTLKREGSIHVLRRPDGTVLAYFDAELFSEEDVEEHAAQIVKNERGRDL